MNSFRGNRYAKSASRAYNNAEQVFAIAPTMINILGAQETDSGCSITTNAGGFRISNGGLYRFSADVSFTADAAGNVVTQFYLNGTPIPSAVSTVTVVVATVYTTHIETELILPACCTNDPVVTLMIGGTTGVVSHVSAGAVKLA